MSTSASSNNALISAAHLLRNFHDASQSFLVNLTSEQKCWQLPARYPQEVMCHGDFAPYNVVLDGEQAIGVIDFDTCHPGPRSWDIGVLGVNRQNFRSFINQKLDSLAIYQC